MIPITTDVLVLRTDFSDDNIWEEICSEIMTPNNDFGFLPNVEFCNETQYKNLTLEHLLSLLPASYPHWVIFLVDNETISNKEHPVLSIDLLKKTNKPFRVIPTEMWGIENNITIGNMDFIDFANSTDDDGIFRGFQY